MSDMQQLTKVIQAAYREIGMKTPLPVDCGPLCGCACCHGDAETGMYVFPGERVLLERALCFSFPHGAEPFVVCSGSCRRSRRPLSCRIFPFMPILENDQLYIVTDPRGRLLCPLLRQEARPYYDPEFIPSLYRAFSQFLLYPELRKSIERLTQVRATYVRFLGEP